MTVPQIKIIVNGSEKSTIELLRNNLFLNATRDMHTCWALVEAERDRPGLNYKGICVLIGSVENKVLDRWTKER